MFQYSNHRLWLADYLSILVLLEGRGSFRKSRPCGVVFGMSWVHPNEFEFLLVQRPLPSILEYSHDRMVSQRPPIRSHTSRRPRSWKSPQKQGQEDANLWREWSGMDGNDPLAMRVQLVARNGRFAKWMTEKMRASACVALVSLWRSRRVGYMLR